MRRSARYPKEAPVCKYITWGIVSLVGVDVSSKEIRGRQQPMVEVRAETLFAKGWSIAPYADLAWLDELVPLTPAAREMLAIARSDDNRRRVRHMKLLTQRIEDVRAYVADKLRDVPGSSSYIMELDTIAHDAQRVDALHRFIDQHMHGDECECGYCIDARDILSQR